MPTSLIEALQQARQLIQDPKNWIKGGTATDAQGRPTSPAYPTATCFCALGALGRVTPPVYIDRRSTYVEAIVALRRTLALEAKAESVAHFNDHKDTTHADVLALFDRTISRLEQEHVQACIRTQTLEQPPL